MFINFILILPRFQIIVISIIFYFFVDLELFSQTNRIENYTPIFRNHWFGTQNSELFSVTKLLLMKSKKTYQVGTGFYYCSETDSFYFISLITARHNLDSTELVSIAMPNYGDLFLPKYTRDIQIDILPKNFIFTEDSTIDITGVVLFIWPKNQNITYIPHYNIIKKGFNIKPALTWFMKENFPDSIDDINIDYNENVKTLGFPFEEEYRTNITPLQRSGSSASYYNYIDNPNNYIYFDIPTYGGSSGSPLFINNPITSFNNLDLLCFQNIILIGMVIKGMEKSNKTDDKDKENIGIGKALKIHELIRLESKLKNHVHDLMN